MARHACRPLLLAISGLLLACGRPATAADADARGADAREVAEEAGDSELLDAIAAAQAAHDHVQGRYIYRNVPADDPDAEGKAWTGRFAFRRPDRFAVRLVEDGVEGYEAWRSDGESLWHIVALDFQSEPVVKRTAVAEADDKGLQWHRIGRFILLDREAVEEDFVLRARTLEPDDQRLDPEAVAVDEVILTPRTEAVRERIRRVVVQFDADHHPVAVCIHDRSDNLLTAVITEADHEQEPPAARFRWGD